MPDIKLISTTAMKSTLDEVLPKFERDSGHKVMPSYGPSPRLTKQIAEGEACDAAIVGAQNIDDLDGLYFAVLHLRFDAACLDQRGLGNDFRPFDLITDQHGFGHFFNGDITVHQPLEVGANWTFACVGQLGESFQARFIDDGVVGKEGEGGIHIACVLGGDIPVYDRDRVVPLR